MGNYRKTLLTSELNDAFINIVKLIKHFVDKSYKVTFLHAFFFLIFYFYSFQIYSLFQIIFQQLLRLLYDHHVLKNCEKVIVVLQY